MKLKNLFLGAMALLGLAAFAGCNQKEDFLSKEPSVEITPKKITFGKDIDTKTFTITATRDWQINSTEPWLGFEPKEGKASLKPQTVTVTVIANNGYNRTAKISVKAGLASETLVVEQAGEKGELAKGDGTQASPFIASAAREFVSTLAADAQTDDYYFVTGFVKKITTKEADIPTYGNQNFYIVDTADDMDSTDDFYCFQVLDLDGAKFTSMDQIKVGDEVTVQGRFVNYNGNTPETVGSSKPRLVMHNGTEGSVIEAAETGVAKGTGTQADPYNATAAIEACKALGTDVQSSAEVYIKGYVKTASISTSYGNADFDIVDEKDGKTETFKIYRVMDFGGEKFTDANKVKVGDEIVVFAKIVNYKGNTPETVQGGKLISINGTAGEEIPYGTAAGTGTEADPYNATAALKAAEALAADTPTTDFFFIKGFVKAVGTSDADVVKYGNVNFDLVDTKDANIKSFNCYRVLDFFGEAFTEPRVKVGDEVVLKAQLVNYKGNTPETVEKTGMLISVNGSQGSKPALTLDKTSLSFTYEGGSQTVNATVDGEGTLAATSDADFVTASVSGMVVTITCAKNEGAARNATVTVTYGDGTKTVAVSQEKDPNYAPGGGAQDGETKYELTNAEIVAACKVASGSGYANLTISSAGGDWTANTMTNSSGSQAFLQMRNAAGSFASSPKYNGTITRVVISVKVSSSASTSNPRSIYVVPKVDAAKLLSSYPTKDNKYTLDTMAGYYGKIDFDLKELTSTPESFEVKFTDTNVSEFSLLAYNGAVYVDSVVVYVK